MSATYWNYCKWASTTAGTGAFTVGTAAAPDLAGPHATPENCNVINGHTYRYYARTGSQTEWGTGVYNSTTHTLSRTTIINNSAGTTTPINFTSNPVVDLFPVPNIQLDGQQLINYIPVNKAGDTMTGPLTMSGTYVNVGVSLAIAAGDISAVRPSAPSTGVIFLGNTGHYVYFDGSNYNMPSNPVLAGNGRLWGSSDASQIVMQCRAVYVGDTPIGNFTQEPFGSYSVVSGVYDNGGGTVLGRYRAHQFQLNGGGWFNFG
ncbi:hypothetical protein [Bradyrhizobium sp. S3.7.6]